MKDSSTASEPVTWVVTGYRAGERSQVVALAEGLGWPFQIKDVRHQRGGFAAGLLRRISLSGIDLPASSPLSPPWPDLLISAGMRNEPVARWVQQQSGNRTRLVHVGRPWVSPDHFDLVISTPQYRLPDHKHVLQNDLTLHRVTPARLQLAAESWAPRLAHLPRPYIAVIVGGHSGPLTFDRRAACALAQQAGALAQRLGGSLLVSTSARTSRNAADALADALANARDTPHHFYRWDPESSDNPYFGYLALAEQIVVTADSIAMLSEACATEKPVYLFRPPPGAERRINALLYRALMRWGPQRLSRDISLVHNRLIETGQVAWLDSGHIPRPGAAGSEMARACARVRQIMNRQE